MLAQFLDNMQCYVLYLFFIAYLSLNVSSNDSQKLMLDFYPWSYRQHTMLAETNFDRRKYMKFMLALLCLYFRLYIFSWERKKIQHSMLANHDDNKIYFHNYDQYLLLTFLLELWLFIIRTSTHVYL